MRLRRARDSFNPKSLWGPGPYGPSGFRLVDRAYSSERPEAEIPGPDRICKGCAYTLVLIKHYDLVVYYQSSRALRGVGYEPEARAGRNLKSNNPEPIQKGGHNQDRK